ncbi:hypothetical protein [Sphingobacterium multivorum]|nr:hypothetical protein [Sphingobacterium multivorum]
MEKKKILLFDDDKQLLGDDFYDIGELRIFSSCVLYLPRRDRKGY